MTEIMKRDPKFIPEPKSTLEYPIKKKTLNSDLRKKELQRITLENYKILQRIQSRKSNYSNNKWKADHQKQLKMKQRISNFPARKNPKVAKSARRLSKGARNYKKVLCDKRSHNSRNPDSLPMIEEVKYQVKSYDAGFNSNPKTNISNHRGQKLFRAPQCVSPVASEARLSPMKITGADIQVDDNRKIIYRKIHKFNKKNFLIEIGKTKVRYFIVVIELSKKQRTQAIELHSKQAKKIITNCGGVEELAKHIEFKFGKIVIKDLNKLLTQPIQPLAVNAFKDKRQNGDKNLQADNSSASDMEPLIKESEGEKSSQMFPEEIPEDSSSLE
ncbi:unnamed protein product [Moneuplotes crassus]|uniref:Uncharacterized protein n=1 Tax=Euplotes crassus TaxID=5936 RepID=A0AAD1UPL1_EUPCR|nr:unnamed protein product [Moneuplotes crassus]